MKLRHQGPFPFILVAALFLLFPAPLRARTVVLPLSLDYPLLRSFLVQAVYRDPGPSAMLMDAHGGCRKVVISEPRIGEEKGLLRFETRVEVRAGLIIFGKCLLPVQWKGYLVLFQRPQIGPKWTLSFKTEDSALYNKDRRRAGLAGLVWNLVKEDVFRYLEGIRIDLGPPLSDLHEILKSFFPPQFQIRATHLVESMHPGQVRAAPDAVRVEILTDVEKTYEEEEALRVTKEEVKKFIENWEAWDAYLVQIFMALADKPLSDKDRQILLDTLLSTRQRFVTELLNDRVAKGFVGQEFIQAWEKISPVFRRQLGDKPSDSILGYLAFFTASDALVALEKIGPDLGIEISRNGLIRLIRLVAEKETTLPYELGLDPELRKLLGLGAAPEVTGPAFDLEELQLEEGDGEPPDPPRAWFHLFREAWAEEPDWRKDLDRIRPWLSWKGDSSDYLDRVKTLLQRSPDNAPAEKGTASRYQDFFPILAWATAWQESCFRQFVVKNDKVTYLLSYNNTSVGLMQINMRVWRGIYDLAHLRWDAPYNAAAGCEILRLYLQKYALGNRKGTDTKLDRESLSRLVYAMYNGGPEQYEQFLSRRKSGQYMESDKLFYEKYRLVVEGRWELARGCLTQG